MGSQSTEEGTKQSTPEPGEVDGPEALNLTAVSVIGTMVLQKPDFALYSGVLLCCKAHKTQHGLPLLVSLV